MSDVPNHDWKCSGCGILCPDKKRVCDCATSCVFKWENGRHFSEWKADEGDESSEITSLHAEITTLRIQLVEARAKAIEECAKRAEATDVGYSALHGRQRIATAIRALSTTTPAQTLEEQVSNLLARTNYVAVPIDWLKDELRATLSNKQQLNVPDTLPHKEL